jgi:hypothetical protein
MFYFWRLILIMYAYNIPRDIMTWWHLFNSLSIHHFFFSFFLFLYSILFSFIILSFSFRSYVSGKYIIRIYKLYRQYVWRSLTYDFHYRSYHIFFFSFYNRSRGYIQPLLGILKRYSLECIHKDTNLYVHLTLQKHHTVI